MVQSKSWQWEQVSEPYWREPAVEVYYLAGRWQRPGCGRVLDLGCGVGRHSLLFARRGLSVDAFDLSPSGVAELERAAQALGLHVRTRVGDMLSLPYESSRFDAVLAFHVIYHSDHAGVERVLAEIERVLVPGGEVYVTFNSLENGLANDPANIRVDNNTIVKTEGVEAGIPHYYVDEAEVRGLLARFQMIWLVHQERIWEDGRAWHYHVLARKPANGQIDGNQ